MFQIRIAKSPFLRENFPVRHFPSVLLLQVEKTKRALSSTHQARLEIEALYDGVDFSETLTRARFEAPLVDRDFFEKTKGTGRNLSWSWWSTSWKMCTVISILLNIYSTVFHWIFIVLELNSNISKSPGNLNVLKWFWGIERRPLQEHLGTCEAGAGGFRPRHGTWWAWDG